MGEPWSETHGGPTNEHPRAIAVNPWASMGDPSTAHPWANHRDFRETHQRPMEIYGRLLRDP